MVRNKAYRYWFFLYNLVHEFLAENVESEKESPLVDFKDVEKRFAGDEVMDEQKIVGSISIASITRVLEQFIECSNYAEFATRLKLLKSFENYLAMTEKSAKKTRLIAIMHNLHSYFSQFSDKVQEQIEFSRKPVEKKLKEFVKIESFNKDLSYFSMRSNIQRVHRHLHKIIKEFEVELKKKINDLFIYKDSSADFQEFKKPQHLTALKIESFLAEKLNHPAIPTQACSEILQKIEKYFNKSQKIVTKTLENSLYPSLIETFQEMMDKELETSIHLRSLEVNREQPRNKQKSQAKHILTQKRKALTDFFKELTFMGISYKTGMLTISLNSEINDLEISPFSVANHSQNLDLYFNKSVLKMKLLRNALLMPRPDMDHGFLERMKGFAIDFFVVVKEQRTILSANVNQMTKLEKFLEEVEIVGSAGESLLNFEAEFKKLEIVKQGVVEAVEVMEQFKILMKCSPSDVDSHHQVLNSTRENFNQKSPNYPKVVGKIDEILVELKKFVRENRKISTKKFQYGNFKKSI